MNQSLKTIEKSSEIPTYDENQARIYLAALYRIIDFYGWSDLTLTHATTKVPDKDSHFLINPFGVKFNHIKASDFVEMDFSCNLIGEQDVAINNTASIMHSSIYNVRPDITTIIHAHTPYGVALSTLDCGLLYLDQAAMIFYNKIGYHDYKGLISNIHEKPNYAKDLGRDKYALILRNHGLLVCGRSIDEAFLYLYLLEFACRTQILAMSTGAKLIQPSAEVLSSFSEQAEKFKKKVHSKAVKGGIKYPSFKALVNKMDRLDPSFRN